MAFLFLLLFLGLSHLLQKGPYLVKAENIIVNDEELTISSGQSLIVNITAGRAHLNNASSNLYNLSIVGHSLNKWNYAVAHLVFTGNIVFERGSTVHVTGSNALSIESRKGSIVVSTSINMTCTTTKMDNETCLGGYGVSVSPITNTEERDIYPGLGPGINNDEVKWESIRPDSGGNCILSSGHGVHGAFGEDSDQPKVPFYGREQNDTPGGSGGACFQHKGRAAGGGALELVALNGTITISEEIDANAQSTPVNCSGGSGRLIRLKARESLMERSTAEVLRASFL